MRFVFRYDAEQAGWTSGHALHPGADQETKEYWGMGGGENGGGGGGADRVKQCGDKNCISRPVM